MTISKFSILRIFFPIILFIIIAACSQFTKDKPQYYLITGMAQGSEYNITYENSVKADLSEPVDSILRAIDQSMSIYNPQSEISKINRGDTAIAGALLVRVIQLSQIAGKNTNGAFDITVGPLVKAWGFGPEGRNVQKNLRPDTLLKYVGIQNVTLSGNRVLKKFPQVFIDVNGIAQGFTADVIAEYFDSLKIKNYLIEIGGEIRAKGKNSRGETWKIGIDKPDETNQTPGTEIQAVLKLDNASVATSGNYRKFYESDGIKYTHTIDPATGYPAKNRLLSATIVAKTCAMADAYATACMVMGLEKAIQFVENNNEIEAYFIYGNNSGGYGEYISKGIKNN